LLIAEVGNGFEKCLWAVHEQTIPIWRGLVKYIFPLTGKDLRKIVILKDLRPNSSKQRSYGRLQALS
jgi:hypothetical protein